MSSPSRVNPKSLRQWTGGLAWNWISAACLWMEALAVVDRYLDDAFLSGLSEVNIIHGKGTGALRTGVQDYLRRHPRVKSFRIGNYGEGDAGVTVVTLKK